jgi:uncharacterized RDD family membrane protein YckC
MNDNDELEYVGFAARVGAALIDTALLLVIVIPLLHWFYGEAYWDPERTGWVAGPADLLVSWVFPAVATVLFWLYRAATPGKMAIGARVVDARTGQPPSFTQSVLRYLGYFVSTLPLCAGLFWVGFDARKQGWHDKMAGTVVVRSKRRGVAPVHFGTKDH